MERFIFRSTVTLSQYSVSIQHTVLLCVQSDTQYFKKVEENPENHKAGLSPSGASMLKWGNLDIPGMRRGKIRVLQAPFDGHH